MKFHRYAICGFCVCAAFLCGVRYSSHVRRLKARMCGYEFYRYDDYDRMVKLHLNWDVQIRGSASYLLGDSHIQGLFTENVMAGGGGVIVNYGIGSDTTWGLLDRLHKYESIKTGTLFLIKIGCNDFAYRETTPKEVVSRISSIVQMMPVGSRIILSSQLPVTRQRDELSRKLREINDLTKALAQGEGCDYLDSWSILSDENGFLRQDYDLGDGVHLNSEGYAVWTRAINEVLSCQIMR